MEFALKQCGLLRLTAEGEIAQIDQPRLVKRLGVEFTYDKASDTYTGDIHTLTATRAGLLVRPAMPRNDREPGYQIVVKDAAGEAEVGVA